jgi:hypothetical protein
VRELGNGNRKYRLQRIYPHVKNPGNATAMVRRYIRDASLFRENAGGGAALGVLTAAHQAT